MSRKHSTIIVESPGDSNGTSCLPIYTEPGKDGITGAVLTSLAKFYDFTDDFHIVHNGDYVKKEEDYVVHGEE